MVKLIFVRLLDEGTEVFRPTQAIDLGDGLYEILPTANYGTADEQWEFAPGTPVRTEWRQGTDGGYEVAVKA